VADNPVLKRGDEGPDVARFQDLVNRDGAILQADGDFGSGTEVALREFQARSGLTVSAAVDGPTWEKLSALSEPCPDIPSRAVSFICREEVSSREYYDAHASRPTWPGGASGVTIGVGYDLGYESGMEVDWGHLLAPVQIVALKPWVGVKGAAAEAAIAGLSGIIIPWYSAWLLFIGTSLPSYVTKTKQAFGNPPGLPPLCFGMLVSLVYNRGASMTDSASHPGDRQEMRDIRDAMASSHFDRIPGLLRSMERLWPLGNGLRTRREQEAEMFEAGLGL
jgi:peptidoglycan hydrolase-like protein with peptidoglycan-binding domain